ncbi:MULTISPECIES: heat shock protein Hsp18 [Clostridium]|uniref:heat shock protein Hsp18 n=1 Tax=Clostridium TaxID=1485 RepID=UPI00069E0161|nr:MULTISPECIES: heat shock protein Hsp18 [Clostridium]KOF58073.1 heat-shock protein [Clostridium sp. DMHC 10]MCD2346919.1 Hsp20/alpha crystallin family protein [Clostridium guangxiense]
MFGMVPFRRNNNSVAKRGDYFEDFFNNFFSDDFFAPAVFNNNSFKVDVKEDDNQYLVEADLPGMKKENIALEYENNYLTISAKREDVLEDKRDNYVRRERNYGEFRRSFYVDNVDENNVNASFADGVLKITLPKKEKGKESRKQIDIH